MPSIFRLRLAVVSRTRKRLQMCIRDRCEGALLVVDAAQGIEAQTLGNTYLAIDAGLEVVPVINKIDLPAADAPRVKKEIEDIIGIPAEDSPEISAKMNINCLLYTSRCV